MTMENNKHFDVVVVGTGNAALSAAVTASEKNRKVLMLEKGPEHKRGGNSYFTDGAIRFAYNDLDGIRSIVEDLSDEDNVEMPEYSVQDFHDDLMKVTQGKSNPKLADHLVSKSHETILWMKEQGVKFIMNENQFYETDGKKTFWGGLLSNKIKWNFTKFVIDRNGEVVKSFGPQDEPEKMDNLISELLNK